MYEDYKIYGPYKGKDERLRIIAVDINKKKHTISYPKYLLECYLNRQLLNNEQVDHIDGNPLNNSIENLQVLKLGQHQKLDIIRNKDIVVKCQYCKREFTIKGSKLSQRNRTDRIQTGYFCSKECSGKYGREIQLHRKNKCEISSILPIKYKLKNNQ